MTDNNQTILPQNAEQNNEIVLPVDAKVNETSLNVGADEQSATQSIQEGKTNENIKETPVQAEVHQQKSPLELYSEQINIADTAGSQQNTFQLMMEKLASAEQKGLIINLTSTNQIGAAIEEKISFTDFKDKLYYENCRSADSLYLEHLIASQLEHFMQTRILVINDMMPEQEIVMALVELLVLAQKNFSGNYVCSCTLERNRITISSIVNQYKLQQKTIGEKGKKQSPAIIIIFCSDKDTLYNGTLLQPLIQRGGIADAVTQTLAKEQLHLVVVGCDMALYKAAVREKAHFAIAHISKNHLLLFGSTAELTSFSKWAPLMERALSEYGWMKEYNSEKQETKLLKLISTGELEAELHYTIEHIDLEENQLLSELARNPLNATVLFVATYFEGISLNEFDCLVRILLLGLANQSSDDMLIKRQLALLSDWEIQADQILITCGIVTRETLSSEPIFQFERQTRKKYASILLRQNYPLYLFRSIDLIKSMLTSESSLGEVFLKNFMAVLFTTPESKQGQTLADICLKITTQLIDISYTEDHLQTLFQRLLFILQSWSVNSMLSNSLNAYYSQMMTTPFRRYVLGTLLAQLCIPSDPDKMELLRMLLNGTGEKEYFIKFKIPRRIINNYFEVLGSLQSIVEGWIDFEAARTSKAYTLFQSSLLLLFYEKRFDSINKSSLDYRLVSNVVVDSQYLKAFGDYFFSSKTTTLFYDAFEKENEEFTHDSRQLRLLQTESLYSVYAIILIRCQYLIKYIQEENMEIIENSNEKIIALVSLVCKKVSPVELIKALQRAILEYNIMFNRMKNKSEEKQRYKVLRDGARVLKEMIVNN